MATYTYRCQLCDSFDVVQPMSSVQATYSCPGCGAEARRVYNSPSLRTTSRGLHRAADTAAESAEAPQVVRSIPNGAPRPRQPRWSPFTGAKAVNGTNRPTGPYPSLPRS